MNGRAGTGIGETGPRASARGSAALKLIAIAAVVGAIGGLLGVGFRVAAEWLQHWVVGQGDAVAVGAAADGGSYFAAVHALPWWRRLVTPAIGALAAGILIHLAARRDTAFGLTDLMEVVTFRRRPIRVGSTVARIGGALATLASGGSVGREGPVIQLGATVASVTGRAFRRNAREVSILLAAGVAAGMAAAYGAPIAGALFVMEALLSNFAMDVFAAVAAASIAGALVMRAFLGSEPMYALATDVAGDSLATVATALPLGIACGFAAVAFQRLLQRATATFARVKLPTPLKPALGGLLVGAIGLLWPEVWGNGFEAVNALLRGSLPVLDPARLLGASVLVLLVMKPIATACSVGSGGQGGVFTPSMFLGAALGALAASAASRVPGLDVTRPALVVIGMGGLIAGVTHAPIAAVALLFEMTHHAALVVPLAACAVASALTAKLLARDSLYTESLRKRGVPVDAGVEELTLRQMRVGDLLDSEAATIAPTAPLREIVDRFTRDHVDLLWVVDERGVLHGAVTLHDVKDFFNRSQSEAGLAVIAADVMRKAPVLDPESSLAEVLELFDIPEFDELPVARADQVLLGRVTRRDLLATLNLEVLGRPSLRAKFVIEGDEHPRYLELPSGYEVARLPVTKALAGRRLGDTGLRRNQKIVVLAIVRSDPEIGEQRIAFDPDLVLEEGEQLVVMGRREDIARC